MAIGRWVASLQSLSEAPSSETVVHQHVRAGRLAHRTLRTVMPKSGMRRYCGLLTSAVVVAEFVHPVDEARVERHIGAGIARANLRPGRTPEQILAAVSAALRTGARLLESMVERAEPAARTLAARAETIEAEVQSDLSISGTAYEPR
ncbi:MAG: hypothetical protein HC923_09250 [Myxococcales bacterium]|nr:hypothetical protein [Myxococcales bacterium]